MMVSVLFARRDSIYKSLPDLDVWDVDRDARNFAGPGPIIAHPPCRYWGPLVNVNAARYPDWQPDEVEKGLARLAVKLVERFGGVLEHPLTSRLWCEVEPTFVVDQWAFGHLARKRTNLYIVGCAVADLPPFPLRLGTPEYTVGNWQPSDKRSIFRKRAEETPPAFAEWLVEVAKLCSN